MKRLAWLSEVPVAHRGLHGRGTVENSLGAFAAAVRARYAIELDVHVSSDGEAIVFHDDELDRLTGAHGPVGARTARELTATRLNGSDETIPTLKQVFDLVDNKVPILVELKREPGQDHRLERRVCALLDDYRGTVAIQCFDPVGIAWFAKARHDVPRGQLAVGRLPSPHGAEPDFIGYYVRNLRSAAAIAARARGLPILAWTVRTKHDLELARAHADNVIFEGIVP